MGQSFSYSPISTSDQTINLTSENVAHLLKIKKDEDYKKFLKYVEQNKVWICKMLEDSLKECLDDDKYFAITTTKLYCERPKFRFDVEQWCKLRQILKISETDGMIILSGEESDAKITIKYLKPSKFEETPK